MLIRRIAVLVVLAGLSLVGFGQPTNLAPQRPVPAVEQPHMAPVSINGKVLFQAQGVLSFTPEARAAAITKRITELSKNIAFDPQSRAVSDAEGTSDISAGDLVIMSVTDQDALVAGKPRQALAQDYADRINSNLTGLRKEYSVKSLTLGGAYALVATFFLIVVFRVLSFLFPKLYAKIDSWRGSRIPSLRIQEFEILPADRIADSAIGLAKLLRFAVALVVLYFYASLVLGFFPWTRDYAHILIGYILAPLGNPCTSSPLAPCLDKIEV